MSETWPDPPEIPRQYLRIAEPYAQRDELIATILQRLAGGETVTSVCADPALPSVGTFFRWIRGDEDAWQEYLHARESASHALAAKALDEAFSATDPALGALRVRALQWTAGKLGARFYGESTQLRHADADGGKLDTAPLVGELLALLQPASPGQAAAAPKPKGLENQPIGGIARPVYRPRAPAAGEKIEDLI